MDKDIWRTRGSLATYPRYPVSQSPLSSSLHCSCRRVHHHEVPHVHPLPLHPLLLPRRGPRVCQIPTTREPWRDRASRGTEPPRRASSRGQMSSVPGLCWHAQHICVRQLHHPSGLPQSTNGRYHCNNNKLSVKMAVFQVLDYSRQFRWIVSPKYKFGIINILQSSTKPSELLSKL